MEMMKISVAQLDVSYKNKADNLQKVEEMLLSAETVGDLVLLPELFSTGYIFNDPGEIHELSEQYDQSHTIQSLSRLAQTFDTLIVAGIAESHNNRFYNSVAVVDGNGLLTSYRKISQTRIDKKYFSRGAAPVTFRYRGMTFGIAVCFDLWFPEIIREYVKMGVDVLLHPANFGGQQSHHISLARAIENSFYVVTCNRTGRDITRELTGEYCGGSQICTPSGSYLVKLDDASVLATAEISINEAVPKQVIGVSLKDEIDMISTLLDK